MIAVKRFEAHLDVSDGMRIEGSNGEGHCSLHERHDGCTLCVRLGEAEALRLVTVILHTGGFQLSRTLEVNRAGQGRVWVSHEEMTSSVRAAHQMDAEGLFFMVYYHGDVPLS